MYNVYVQITKSYKFRLKPTAEQEALFVQFAGCRRFVWNWGLQRRMECYTATRKGITYNAQSAELTILKKQPDTAFLSFCSADVLQSALRDLDRAFVDFFEKRKRYPKFKGRKQTNHSFRFPQNVRITGQMVSLPKIGKIKAIIHRPVEGTTKSATIKQEAGGAWYVVFTAHVEAANVSVSCDNPVGIDAGIKSLAVLSTGETINPLKGYYKAEKKLSRLNRALTRCDEGSKRWGVARKRLGKHHNRTANQRQDFLHNITTQIVRNHDTICIEDLNVSGFARNKRVAKAFFDAALGEFFRQLQYKAAWQCKQVVKVGRFFPSSKTCHLCGKQTDISLKDREWLCDGCGVNHDRDFNAAMNILHEGLSLLSNKC